MTALPTRKIIARNMRDEQKSLDSSGQLKLATAACAGDRDAFGELFRLLYNRIHRTVWAMMGNEAEAHDVAQEAWIKAWERKEHFNFSSAFSTWIHRIAVNTALDALRERKHLRHRFKALFSTPEQPVTWEPSARAADNPDQRLAGKELEREIEQAVADLPDDQRTVLVLREFEGYSYEEIAQAVGCKTGTVMSRLHHARKKLQARLARKMS